MIFQETEAGAVRCPFAPYSCLGGKCALFRWIDHEQGYCGAGGPARQRPDASIEAESVEGRIARETRPASPKQRR